MANRPAPNNPDSSFSLLSHLPMDLLEDVFSIVLEDSNCESCIAGGVLPAISSRSEATWSDFTLRGFFADGFFNVTKPLECDLLRLNARNSDFATDDIAARPIPHIQKTHENGQPFSAEYRRSKALRAINASGFELVVDGVGNLRLNLANSTLEAATASEQLTHVTEAWLSADEMTRLWINELVVLPEARLVPFSAPELRPRVFYATLSSTVTLVGRPRVFAKIPLACKVPFESTSIWYAVIPSGLREKPDQDHAHARGPPEHTFEEVLGATLWRFLCGTNHATGPALLKAFCKLPKSTKEEYAVTSSLFAQTAPGERLRRKPRVSAAEADRAAAAIRALDGILDF